MTIDDLGNRMKTFYEQISKIKLMRRTPVIIRIDGKAFHTFTRGFKRPFDDVLIKTMQETTKYLCENIQGCVLGYCQSDEISLVLVDYQRFETSAWFDYEIQKMCSISASMATMAFNKIFSDMVGKLHIQGTLEKEYSCILYKAAQRGAMFDARVFNIPKEEVTNCIYWRQLDASRNSIQMVGQANFSHKELQNKSCNDIQDMLMMQKGINWNDFPIYQKRGSCCIKEKYFEPVDEEMLPNKGKSNLSFKFDDGCSNPCEDIDTETGVWRTKWIIDTNIPIFKGDGRKY
ncbi:MAG: tRNA(His) guanylyltransferase Thg1 family protein, partial [Clostridia bacterium]|nr:tRNA(His) guanylyltransferase Thg1 family protein [Clostridia bacterium]